MSNGFKCTYKYTPYLVALLTKVYMEPCKQWGSTCSGGPRTGGLPRSTCPRISGLGVHQSWESIVSPTLVHVHIYIGVGCLI